MAALRNVQLISLADKRDNIGVKLNFSRVVAIKTVLVNIRKTSCSKNIQDEGDELLTYGSIFPGNAVSCFKDLSL